MIISPPQSRNKPLLPATILQTTGDLPVFRALMGIIDAVRREEELQDHIRVLGRYPVFPINMKGLPLSMPLDPFLDLAKEQDLLGDLWGVQAQFDPQGKSGYDASEHWQKLLRIAAQLPIMFFPPRVNAMRASVRLTSIDWH